jgi:MoaA/NifB/PqqE/SkfB family radical SAM enzyme
MKLEDQGDLSESDAYGIVSAWTYHQLRNIRFSGGEPTVWGGDLPDLVSFCRSRGVKRIAVSTNGSAPLEDYKELMSAGVNDFSISLDACCAADGQQMAGFRLDMWDRIIKNIEVLAHSTYVTVGVVLTDWNISQVNDIVRFASGLGVADIRVIPAAQKNDKLSFLEIPFNYLIKHPILRYRYNNFKNGRPVRGIKLGEYCACPLVLDDMAVLNGKHYPCIIYMREHGDPIGNMFGQSIEEIREERRKWFESTCTFNDPICFKNCLDVCVDYNTRVFNLKGDRG